MSGPGALLSDEKRSVLDTHRAQHLRATKHGWTVLFDAPNRAIRCAEQLRALGRGRTGGIALHVGACSVSDGNPVGSAREVAQQIADTATPGMILVSDTLRDILAGSDVRLVRRAVRAGASGSEPLTAWVLTD